ncbi:M24 family metallopeptidase, partial [Enterococcus faecalis]|uniref:M24 family metallopeptidase n=1 Tax=Enterococcus faecalis TaxID=1351 RepID=UPI00403F1CE6
PKAICTSINHVVCHGIPGPKPLREGDIVNVDVTLIVDGWHGDSSRMYAVGPISRRAARLIEVTYESLARGIAAVKPGATTADIGIAIQS